MNFDQSFEKLIGHEGGYVNNPSDPGGETKYGISKRSYPDVDIKNLTLDAAKEIYKRDFWQKAGCDELPEKLRFQVFDTAVNSGVGQAVRFLQRALGVADDGKIGPVTRQVMVRCDEVELAVRFNAERLIFMASLSNWPTFGRGWAKRVADNLKEIF